MFVFNFVIFRPLMILIYFLMCWNLYYISLSIAGLIAYYVVIALYLYGDLAIYCAAVPKSITQVVW